MTIGAQYSWEYCALRHFRTFWHPVLLVIFTFFSDTMRIETSEKERKAGWKKMKSKMLPIVYENIKEIIDENLYFIDKGLQVKELLAVGGKITLLTSLLQRQWYPCNCIHNIFWYWQNAQGKIYWIYLFCFMFSSRREFSCGAGAKREAGANPARSRHCNGQAGFGYHW